MIERWQHQEVQVKESRRAEEIPQRWKKQKGEDRAEMKKEAKLLRCTLLEWISVEYREEIHEKIQRKVRRLLWNRAQIEEGGNGGTVQQRGQGRMEIAADAARITDERASSEDRKHTSGGVFVAVDSNLGAIVGAEEGAIESIPGNEGRIAQAWVNVRGGLRIFSVYFWHSEGWTPRNEALLEAVLKRARTTRHPWLKACDANMCPEDFEKSLWFQRETMHVVVTERSIHVQVKRP